MLPASLINGSERSIDEMGEVGTSIPLPVSVSAASFGINNNNDVIPTVNYGVFRINRTVYIHPPDPNSQTMTCHYRHVGIPTYPVKILVNVGLKF